MPKENYEGEKNNELASQQQQTPQTDGKILHSVQQHPAKQEIQEIRSENTGNQFV
jgi:hypothetical protein